MPVAAVAAVVGATAAVVGTVKTIDSQNKANRMAKQQYKFERQMQTNRAVRERRDAIRASRIAGANVVQTAENTGGSGSSAALGTMGSIQSQVNDNLSFLDTQNNLAGMAGEASIRRQSAMNAASNWGAVTQLGMAVFNASGGMKGK